MSTIMTKPSAIVGAPPEDLKMARRYSRTAGLFAPELLRAALKQSFVMLRPDIQWKNPVMFVVEVGTVLTLLFTVARITGAIPHVSLGYLITLDVWQGDQVAERNVRDRTRDPRNREQQG